jgi:PilZ domain
MSVNRGRLARFVGAKSSPGPALTAVPSASEKRRSSRKRGQLPGLVFPGGMAASIPCTIADLSGTGARLLMKDGWVNPFRGVSSIRETFTLVMRMDRMQVECEIVRIDDTTIGVRFISAPKPMTFRM